MYMKVLRISDPLHQHLKSEAKKQGRTLQYLAEERLWQTPAPAVKNVPTLKTTPAIGATGTIFSEPTVVPDAQEWKPGDSYAG